MSERRDIENMQYFLNNRIDSVKDQLNIRIDDVNNRIDSLHSDMISGNDEIKDLLKAQTTICYTARKDFSGRMQIMENWKNRIIGIALGVGALLGLLFGVKFN